MRISRFVTVAALVLLSLSGCGSPVIMGTVDGKRLERYSTPSGSWGVGVVEEETDTWVASFDMTFRGRPTPVVFRQEGVDLIEEVSGCDTIESSVVVDLQWAAVYSRVSC